MPEIDDSRRKWWVLAAMGGVLGLILLDETVVGVALPTIRDDLQMSQVTSHWVVNAYLLVFAGLVVAGGRLGDTLGLRRLFLGGVTLFGLASMMAGLAESTAWILTARSVQGIGAAAIFPASTAVITRVFAPGERGLALGIYAAIGTVFVALGPLVGGFFIDTLSWRWIFWINLPLVAAIALVILVTWTEAAPAPHGSARFDRAGLITLVLGLGALVFAIMEGPEWGWQHPLIWALLACAAIILTLFVLAERQATAPLIELDLFRSPLFTVCTLMYFAAQFNEIAMIVFGALYLQDVLQMSALQAVCGALLATTGTFESVFVVTGCLSLALLVVNWRVVNDLMVAQGRG